MSAVFRSLKKSLCNWEMLLTGIIFALDCRSVKQNRRFCVVSCCIAVSVSHEECCVGLLLCESGGRVCLFLSVDAVCVRVN